jgi:actin cytoskeleton-regulatory complex protein PAN1
MAGGQAAAQTTPSALAPNNSSTNPFHRPQTAPPPSVPAPSKSPAPPAVKTSYHTAPGESEDEWDDIAEKEGDDSSDDELSSSRTNRQAIAQQLFSTILPPARPQSAGPTPNARSTPKPTSPPPSAPAAPPPPAPLAPIFNAPPPGPPPAPPAPAAPIAAPPADVNALMLSIQGGKKLRKAQTNDRSAAPVSGRVVGDTAPPHHINAAVRPPSPPAAPVTSSPGPILESIPMTSDVNSRSSNRQSVDWYAGLAADEGHVVERMPSTAEEDEDDVRNEQPPASVPEVRVVEPAGDIPDPMNDVDKSTGKSGAKPSSTH